MTDPLTVAAVFAVFLVAGGVKGLVGFGLPAVSLALLTLALDLTTAMVLVLVPSFVTNVWQAAAGGNGRAIVQDGSGRSSPWRRPPCGWARWCSYGWTWHGSPGFWASCWSPTRR